MRSPAAGQCQTGRVDLGWHEERSKLPFLALAVPHEASAPIDSPEEPVIGRELGPWWSVYHGHHQDLGLDLWQFYGEFDV